MALKPGLLYRLSLALAPVFYAALSRLLFATCRLDEKGAAGQQALERGGEPYIAAFWHYSILYIVHRARGGRWLAMVSASRDGEYIARILEWMGFAVVRGSKGRGGAGALKGMIASMAREERNAAIVADGSKGPARQVQAGVILLAAKTGAPILPVAWAADRFWTFRSWDRTILPKPFARISFHCGEPLRVPAELSAEEFEHYRLALEERLNGLYRQAWLEFGRAGHGDGFHACPWGEIKG